MIEDLNSTEPTRKRLRNYGVHMGICLGLLAALLLWRGKPVYRYFFALAVLFPALGLLVPRALRPVYRVWMGMALLLGWVMTRVMLSVLFYVGITPIGVVGRLLGNQFLELVADPEAETYWIRREPRDHAPERYEKQY